MVLPFFKRTPSFPARLSMRLITSVFFALTLTIGPLGLMQVLAWTGMVIDYGSRYGVTEGISRTFDGQHPCSMCEKITQQKQAEPVEKSTTSLPSNKLVCLAVSTTQAPMPTVLLPHKYFTPALSPIHRSDSPILRPPRTLAV